MNCCWLNDHWFSWKQSSAKSNSQLCHHLWGFVAWALRHLAEIFTQSCIALAEALRSHLESRLSDSMGWPSSLRTAHVPLVLSFCPFIALLVYLFAVGAPITTLQTFLSWPLESFSEEWQQLKETRQNQMGWVGEKRLCWGKALIAWLWWWGWLVLDCAVSSEAYSCVCGKWQCSSEQGLHSTHVAGSSGFGKLLTGHMAEPDRGMCCPVPRVRSISGMQLQPGSWQRFLPKAGWSSTLPRDNLHSVSSGVRQGAKT